jgi:hypothetical protein
MQTAPSIISSLPSLEILFCISKGSTLYVCHQKTSHWHLLHHHILMTLRSWHSPKAVQSNPNPTKQTGPLKPHAQNICQTQNVDPRPRTHLPHPLLSLPAHRPLCHRVQEIAVLRLHTHRRNNRQVSRYLPTSGQDDEGGSGATETRRSMGSESPGRREDPEEGGEGVG